MTIRFTRSKMSYMALQLLVLFMVLFPYDKYHIKLSFFICYVIVHIYQAKIEFVKVERIFLLYMMTIYPVIVSFVSWVLTDNLYAAISAEYVELYLILVFILLHNNKDIYKILFNALSVIVSIVLFIAVCDMLHIFDLYQNPVTSLILNLGEGQISKSNNAMFYYVIFLNGCPLLLYHFVYSLYHKKHIWSFFSFVSILFTGTRANIFLVILIIVLYVWFILKKKWLKYISFLLILIVLYFVADDLYSKIQIINLAKSKGDIIRSETINAIFDSMQGNVLNWIVGMGHGSTYNVNIGSRVGYFSTSELSYIEMLRTVGILGLVQFLFFLILPIKRIYKSDYRWIILPYISLLLTSIFDPFLHTSTSFVLYILVYYTYYTCNNVKNNK